MSDNGAFDRIAGKAKEAAGQATGNKETETEGKLQQAEGKIKEVAEDAKDAIKGAVKANGLNISTLIREPAVQLTAQQYEAIKAILK